MYKKYTALILAALLVAAEGHPLASKTLPALWPGVEQTNWDGLGLSADVNEYIDNTIYMLVPFIQANGLDPMALPNIEERFEVRPVLITYSASLRLHDGSMSGLVNFARSGDQMVHYFARMLRMRVQLQFRDLEFAYRYLVQVMNIGPSGGINGSLSNFIVTVDLLLDFNNDEIQLQEFSLTDIGNLRVRLTGNNLYDWLVTPLVNVFLRIFDDVIMKVVETNIRDAAQVAISAINSDVHEIIRHLESYN